MEMLTKLVTRNKHIVVASSDMKCKTLISHVSWKYFKGTQKPHGKKFTHLKL